MGACNYSLHSMLLKMRRLWAGGQQTLPYALRWLPQQWWAESSMVLTRNSYNRVRCLRDRPGMTRMISGQK